MIETQICNKCQVPKPLKEFSKKMSNVNGYTKTCTTCIYERQKERKKEKAEWWDEFVTPKW